MNKLTPALYVAAFTLAGLYIWERIPQQQGSDEILYWIIAICFWIIAATYLINFIMNLITIED